MTGEELRAVFVRHEHLTPLAEPVVRRIEDGYRRRRRRRLGLLTSGAVVAVVLAMLGPVAAIGTTNRHTVAAPRTSEADGIRPGPLTFLLAGIDRRPGQSADEMARADTVLLMQVPATRDRVYLVSVSRDTYLDIPASGRYPGGKETINAAYAYGGFRLLRQTLAADFGVHVDGGAVADFAGLDKVVDSVGGIDVYVDERTVSIHVGWTKDGRFQAPYQGTRPVPGVTPKVYPVGYQHLKGWEALDFLRQRVLLPDGEAGRQRHVRQVLVALLNKVRASGVLTDPARVSGFLGSLGRAVTVDSGGLPLLGLVAALDKVRTPVSLAVPPAYTAIGGRPVQIVTPALTDMLSALAHGDLDEWVRAHPDAVAPQ
jgi:LCP family protein required for cell wall assembly